MEKNCRPGWKREPHKQIASAGSTRVSIIEKLLSLNVELYIHRSALKSRPLNARFQPPRDKGTVLEYLGSYLEEGYNLCLDAGSGTTPEVNYSIKAAR